MAQLNSTVVHGVLSVTDSINEGGSLLSAKYAPLSHAHNYLPLSGGTMTGPIKYTGATQEIIRTGGDDASWRGGLKYSWSSNTTIALWGKNTNSQFVWNAGTDFSSADVNGTTTRNYDFQVGRNTSTNVLEVKTGGNIMWHAGNDGPDSGLDADTLDGNHASAFLTSHQTVTDNNPTLAWGTKSKVATIGSTAINVTMPANPDTWRPKTDWNAASGANNEILNKPTIPAAPVQSDWNESTTTSLAYIKNKPTIPAAQVNSDWNATSGKAQILNKPTIPTVNNSTITIKQTGINDQTFTLNGAATTITLVDTNTDTKNTTGGDNTTSKIFLVGMTAQTTSNGNSRTYSNSSVYTTNGTLYASTFNATSSREAKKDIIPTTACALDIINNVEVVDFKFKEDKDEIPHIGFIAEDTDPILSTPKQDKMDYTNCIGVLIKAVQELSKKNEELEKRIKELENK